MNEAVLHGRIKELETMCAEAWQAVSNIADFLPTNPDNDKAVSKILDNLLAAANGDPIPPQRPSPLHLAVARTPRAMDQGTKRGRVVRAKFVTRGAVRAHPHHLFVFGDNMARWGRGGQAQEMRGEPNAIGIPTKWHPHSRPGAFFSDQDFIAGGLIHLELRSAFQRLRQALDEGITVVVPADGLGTGLAQLPSRAPTIHRWIEEAISLLERAYSGETR